MKTRETFSGVLLPSRLQFLFTKQAIKEGYTNVSPKLGDYEWQSEFSAPNTEFEQKQTRIALNALEHRINQYQKQKILEAILLFGKAFVMKHMYFDYSPLVTEGLVELIDVVDYDHPYTFDVTRAHNVRPIFQALEWTMFRNKSVFNSLFDTYCMLINDLHEFGISIPRSQQEIYEREIGYPFRYCLEMAQFFVLAIQDVENYLAFSNKYNAPLLVEIPKQSGLNTSSHQDQAITQASDLVRTYRIFLDEIRYVPLLQNIEDIRRLSKHSALEDFRIAIWSWATAIQRGEVSEESRFRVAIQDSINALAKASKLKQVSRFITYFSIPVSIASTLVGIPIGLAILPISIGIRITIDQWESQNKWVTFGR